MYKLGLEKVDEPDIKLPTSVGSQKKQGIPERGLRQEKKEVTEDEMVGWHNQLNGHEFEQTPGNSDGHGSLACMHPQGCRVRQKLVTDQ